MYGQSKRISRDERGGHPPVCRCLAYALSSSTLIFDISFVYFSELKEAFMLFDYMKTGNIYGDDIGPVIRSIGLKPSEAQIRAIRKDIGQGQSMSVVVLRFL